MARAFHQVNHLSECIKFYLKCLNICNENNNKEYDWNVLRKIATYNLWIYLSKTADIEFTNYIVNKYLFWEEITDFLPIS